MSSRDRIVLIAIVVFGLLGGGWMFFVSPERKKAAAIESQIVEAQTQLSKAEGQLASARAAESQYPAAYASVVALGKAVPASQEVPSLIFELSQASNQRNLDFASITNAASATPAGAAATPGATTAAAGFSQLPFTFGFNGSFFALEHLLSQLEGQTTRTSAGALQVNGRLLTIQGVRLAPESTAGEKASSALAGTITATAYSLPAESAAASSAAQLATGAGSAAPASSTASSSSSPTTPAVARVAP